MPITNNNLPLIDLPMWEILQPLPTASAVGVCACNDLRGTGQYVYILISATSFWRYCTRSNTYQQLASPPGGTLGAGTAMIYDPSRNYVWALITSGTGAPTWQYYDTATNTWTARSVVNLPATFGTDGALAHTCTTYNVAGNDDYIYLIGNAATTLYRFSVTGNSWIATLTASTGTSGAGCSFHWMPAWNTDRIVRVRGTASATVDYYSIVGNSWSGITYLPATETQTTGTIAVEGPVDTASHIWIEKDTTGRIYKLDLATSTLTPFVTQYLVTGGAAHVGDRLFYQKSTDGIEYIYYGLHTSTAMLRTPLIPGV